VTKLLILSDSHSNRLALEHILKAEADHIDALIFLGDGLRDLEQTLTLYPRLRAYAVAGNCDFGALEPLDGLAAFDGVVVFYTHGHMYGVKYDLDTLSDAAAARGANVALFGHTHVPVAEQRGDVFLFNPGSCGRCYTGPNTYGILTLADGKGVGHEHKEEPKARASMRCAGCPSAAAPTPTQKSISRSLARWARCTPPTRPQAGAVWAAAG